jgi:hypothetical protein
MREVLFLTTMAMCLWSQAWAQSEGIKPDARVVFAGEMGKAGSREIQARPGVRFGLELVFEGARKGTLVVLEAKLLSPATDGLPPIRWLVAAKSGAPAQIAWEFAYDWEVDPGAWTMKVFHEEKELVSVPFTVVRAVSPPQAVPGSEGTQERKGAGQIKPSTPPLSHSQRVVGGKPDRPVYALMAGAYSEEARALRAASGLKARGVAPCLRVDIKNGKKLWHVVVGWRDSPEAARKAKAELLPVLGEIFVQPMSAGELETGLTCK